MQCFRRILLVSALLLSLASARAAEPDYSFFEKKIRPVLVEKCYSCHSAEAQKNKKLRGGLLLDTRAGLLKGGDTGPGLVPGKPKESLLIQGLHYGEDLQMPPKGKLPAKVIADFEAWVQEGAPDPRDGKVVAGRFIDLEQGRKFWAFQPPARVKPPTSDPKQSPIDAFLLAAMKAKHLRPVGPATKREWIRRVTFDLIGLPPTPEVIDAFLKDNSPDAHAKVVDRLLESPHYGERWARYWLDVARFAEDQAHTFDVKPYTSAFRYRDWVVKAFNQDMPYDRFVRLQIAGDKMPDTAAEPFDNLAGLGFLGLGVQYYKNTAALQAAADELDDRIDTLTRGFLGLTVACARCHDHKFDPIPTKDYYALAGIYNGTVLKPLPVGHPEEVARFQKAEQAVKQKENDIKKWLGEMAKKSGKKNIPKNQENKLLTPEQRKQLAAMRGEMEKLRKAIPPRPPEVHVLTGSGKEMKVYVRGNPATQGEPAPRGFLQVLPVTRVTGDFDRRELADAIASKGNPLTARVMVNRVWQHHFGRGLVNTPSNFGQLGSRPSHPELLDWLALRFVDNGWSVKKLHRDIVLSDAYRRSSATDAKNAEADADNVYLWRFPRRRLDIEAWRDSILAVSGTLDRSVGGPPLNLSDRNNHRRTVYGRISRHRLDSTLALWDFPDPNVTSAARVVTTVPQQQLFVLNSDFVVDQAKAFARRLQSAAGDDRARVGLAHALAFGRPPTDAEVKLALDFLAGPPARDEKLSRWEQYTQALLGTNEFLYVD